MSNDDTFPSPPTTQDKKRTLRFKHKFALILISLTLMLTMRTGFVFFIIGMLPCIVAYYMDVSKHYYMFQSVFAANLSGMLPYIAKILGNGPSSALLQEIMGNATTWFIIYGSATIGWLLVKTCPMFAQILVLSTHQTQMLRYVALEKKLEREWGPEVKQFSDAVPHDDIV